MDGGRTEAWGSVRWLRAMDLSTASHLSSTVGGHMADGGNTKGTDFGCKDTS